jgi:hypothetical protein
MTSVRAVAVHDVVAATFPREVTEENLVARAVGKALDTTLSQLGHEARIGRRPTVTWMQSLADRELRDALDEGAVDVPADQYAAALEEIRGVARAFRESVLFRLSRPRSRLLVIGADAAVYAQPDFWDGRDHIYEMKSYRAVPPPPDVALQVRLFQLAFPGFSATLVCFDRHARPVTTTSATLPAPTPTETADGLRRARAVALTRGRECVLEYVAGTIVRVSAPADAESTEGTDDGGRGAT